MQVELNEAQQRVIREAIEAGKAVDADSIVGELVEQYEQESKHRNLIEQILRASLDSGFEEIGPDTKNDMQAELARRLKSIDE